MSAEGAGVMRLAHQARQLGLSLELSSAVERTAQAAHAILEARR